MFLSKCGKFVLLRTINERGHRPAQRRTATQQLADAAAGQVAVTTEEPEYIRRVVAIADISQIYEVTNSIRHDAGLGRAIDQAQTALATHNHTYWLSEPLSVCVRMLGMLPDQSSDMERADPPVGVS